MTVGVHSPDTRNYLLGKGVILFKPSGEDAFYHVGNVPTLTITPTVDVLEHFSSMDTESVKDDTVIRSKSGTVVMTLEEFTARNIAMLMLGTVDEDEYGQISVDLFASTSFTGALRFYATNAKGPRWFLDLPKVTFNPSGGFSPISNEYANMEVTGSWEALDGAFGIAYLRPAANTVVPENVLTPFIAGTAQVDEELEVFTGAWIDAASFAFQWQADNVDIPGETERTFTPAVGNIGDIITCVVTATNTVGSAAPVETAGTAAVIAA
jgi:hypothetical protein